MSRLRCSRLIAPALLVACIPVVAHAQYTVPRDSFYSGLHVIALAPVAVPNDLENPEPVRALFAGLVETKLRAAGLEVITPDRTGPVWDSIRALQGGLFDPTTGKLDAEKARQARQAYAGEMARRFNANAILYPSIVVVSARLDNSVAAWDGTQQGTAAKKLVHMLMGASHSGHVPALSLWVELAALDGRDLYEYGGGIQVLEKVGALGKPVPVQRAELFKDQKRNEKAVSIALKPLLEPKRK